MRSVADALQHVETLDYMRIVRGPSSTNGGRNTGDTGGATAREALQPLSSSAENLMRRGGKLLKGDVKNRSTIESSEGNRFIRDDSL